MVGRGDKMRWSGIAGQDQKVVGWRRIGTDATSRPVVSNQAEELELRWDNTTSEVINPDGSTQRIDATVSGFSDDWGVGSALWVGELKDLPGTNQLPDKDVMVIVSFNAAPDFRNRDAYREAKLMRSYDVLMQTGTPT